MTRADEGGLTRTRYLVRVRRDSNLWFIEIPELDGATQARYLKEVEAMAEDFIANATGRGSAEFELDIEFELPDGVAALLAQVTALRREASLAEASAAEKYRAAAKALKTGGYTVRDIGAVLKVSHQRAQQLISAQH